MQLSVRVFTPGCKAFAHFAADDLEGSTLLAYCLTSQGHLLTA